MTFTPPTPPPLLMAWSLVERLFFLRLPLLIEVIHKNKQIKNDQTKNEQN